MSIRTKKMNDAAARRASIVQAARWCFLHFGYGKTSLEDIARRANITRTLLYHTFENKEAIYLGVFEDWFETRYPAATQAATGPGSKAERLSKVCEVMLLEPWAEIEGAPMAHEFHNVCARIEPEMEDRYQEVVLQNVETILESKELAEVFWLALDGLQGDMPMAAVLRRRIALLIDRFVQPISRKDNIE
jgi:TetR/AcrR family transcriptional regulator, transcriptional repressor of aconitase